MTESSSLLASEDRAVPFRRRLDLKSQSVGSAGADWLVVKDPVSLRYHRLQIEQQAVLELLDGRRSIAAIRNELRRRFPAAAIRPNDISRLIAELHDKGLLTAERPGQAVPLMERRAEERWKRVRETAQNVLSLRLPGWDPDRTLTALEPIVRWMFRPWGVAATLAFVLAAWILLLVQFEEFRRGLPAFQEFFSGRNLIFLWMTLAGAKVLHEFGHGLACKRFGGECHAMGVMLLVFAPCLYCDVTDSWMLPDKRRRMIIAAAGMYVEAVVCASAIFVWRATAPGLLHHMAVNLFFVTTVTTIVFNANPLMRLDGYYILSDWIEVPNLREKACRLLRETLAWHCLGIELPAAPLDAARRREWFVAFAAASAAYGWSVTLGVCAFLCVMLKPWGLQSLGIALAALTTAGAMGRPLVAGYRIVSAPRSEPMDCRRIMVTLFVAGFAVVLACVAPIPWNARAPFLLQPEGVRHLVTSTPGRLIDVCVAPGERVAAGQIVAVLQNDDLDEERHELDLEIVKCRSAVEQHRILGEPARQHLASARLESFEARRGDLERRRELLTLRAPCDGIVIAAPQREDKVGRQARLAGWSGTPLDRQNVGAFLEARTHLVSIAPTAQQLAVVRLDQRVRNELAAGGTVFLHFDQLPRDSRRGTIRSIAIEHTTEEAATGGGTPSPRAGARRSNASGATPTVTYLATVAFPQSGEGFRPGLSGEAIVSRQPRSLAGWTWRWIRETWHVAL